MQDFLSGSAFEQMAREYNAKYNVANVLQSGTIQNNGLLKDKEKVVKEIEDIFNEISSLFLFTRKYIGRLGVNSFNKCQGFYFNKLFEIERKVEMLKDKFLIFYNLI